MIVLKTQKYYADSVLDRIHKNRQRPSLATRNDSLIPPVLLPKTSQHDEVESSSKAKKSATTNAHSTAEELEAELAQIPPTNRHSAIVLEKELDQNLTRYGKDNRITMEVFLEAAWDYAATHPEALVKRF